MATYHINAKPATVFGNIETTIISAEDAAVTKQAKDDQSQLTEYLTKIGIGIAILAVIWFYSQSLVKTARKVASKIRDQRNQRNERSARGEQMIMSHPPTLSNTKVEMN